MYPKRILSAAMASDFSFELITTFIAVVSMWTGCFFKGRIKALLKGFLLKDLHPKNTSFLQDQLSQHIVGHFVLCEMPLYKRIYGYMDKRSIVIKWIFPLFQNFKKYVNTGLIKIHL